MKNRILIISIINLLFLAGSIKPVFALKHTEMNGLFSMDIPSEWHWVETSKEVVITYPDGKSVAIEIQLAPSIKLSQTEIKKILKEDDGVMINDGVKAHNGTLISDKEVFLDGVYARQLDFKTTPPDPIFVTYFSFFNKGYAFTVTYGSPDVKMHSMLDDVVATLKFK